MLTKAAFIWSKKKKSKIQMLQKSFIYADLMLNKYFLSMLKTVVLLNIFVETDSCFFFLQFFDEQKVQNKYFVTF